MFSQNAMRNRFEVLDFLKSLDITESQFQKYGTFDDLLMDADIQKLLNFGLVVPYGDAIRYRGQGIILIGGYESGKTPIAKKFKTKQRCKIIGEDALIIYDCNGDGKNVRVMNDPRYSGETWEKTIKWYANHLARQRGSSLHSIVHLDTESNNRPEGFVEPDISRQLELVCMTNDSSGSPKSIPYFLSDVNFLRYQKQDGFQDDTHLQRIYETIDAKLKATV